MLAFHLQIQKQSKMLAVNEAMVEAYSNRCEELEAELKRLKIFVNLNYMQGHKTGSEQEMHVSNCFHLVTVLIP